MNVQKITLNSIKYPHQLSTIYSPPKQLYVLGNSELLRERCVAIVGCRICSGYGAKVARELAYKLGKNNIVTVSGLAVGIDSYCHLGSLEGEFKTIAVVAHGLDMIYPNENKALAKRIVRNGGAIITEYDLGVKPEKEHFPARNRIISGLSESVVVVEAKKQSGSLITANFALEQGRNLFAVPGNMTNPNSKGTNELIKQGAQILTRYEDVFMRQ